jgi:hypothetical protein
MGQSAWWRYADDDKDEDENEDDFCYFSDPNSIK